MDPLEVRRHLVSFLYWVQVLGSGEWEWVQQSAAATALASTRMPASTSTNQRSCGLIKMEIRKEQSADVSASSLGKQSGTTQGLEAPPVPFVTANRVERAAGSDAALKHFDRE